MEQVVLKRQNVPEQLPLLADGLPAQGQFALSIVFNQAYEPDQLREKILKAI
jgi:hypothetical protein